jgi:ribonuclease J
LSLTLTVHRGTRQIGGSCIEIAHPHGDRIILDAGRPLDAPEGATGLLPASLDRSRHATVLISHPHQDHWGLIEELPPTWPIWTGVGSAKLIAITGEIARRPLTRTFETWSSRSGPFAIGPFTVTPILTLRQVIDGDRFPLSPRIRCLRQILEKLEPPAAAVEPPAEPGHARRRR